MCQLFKISQLCVWSEQVANEANCSSTLFSFTLLPFFLPDSFLPPLRIVSTQTDTIIQFTRLNSYARLGNLLLKQQTLPPPHTHTSNRPHPNTTLFMAYPPLTLLHSSTFTITQPSIIIPMTTWGLWFPSGKIKHHRACVFHSFLTACFGCWLVTQKILGVYNQITK